MSDQLATTDRVHAAFQEGRRVGLATGAVALSITSFVNLLGLEKSILAGVLAILALHGVAPSKTILQRGRAALVIAAVQAVTVVVVLVLYYDKLLQLIYLLQKLG